MAEDVEFEKALLERKRHQEITSSLIKVADAITENKIDYTPVIEAINQQSEGLNRFAEIMQNIPARVVEKIPVVKNIPQPLPSIALPNIELNQDKLIEFVAGMGVHLLKTTEALTEEVRILMIEVKKLNERPIVDTFDVTERDRGFLKTVKVNYK